MNDFWWLPDKWSNLNVGLRRFDADDAVEWQFRADLANFQPIAALAASRQKLGNRNVHRTLLLFDEFKQPAIAGPFYLDIDSDIGLDGLPNIEGALKAAQTCLQVLLEHGVKYSDIRILFSGHKGFSIEVRPEALKIDTGQTARMSDWAHRHTLILNEARRRSGTSNPSTSLTIIDGVVTDAIVRRTPPFNLRHHYLRLSDSINDWGSPAGGTKIGFKFEISNRMLFDLAASDLILESSRRAQSA